jgi:8-oxo-dGTP pyrophosphatase MutT (NUDIX family)
MTLIDKVALIRLADGKILSTRSRGKDVYYLPGGKREPGETDVQTLARENREELDVAIAPDGATPRRHLPGPGARPRGRDTRADDLLRRRASPAVSGWSSRRRPVGRCR